MAGFVSKIIPLLIVGAAAQAGSVGSADDPMLARSGTAACAQATAAEIAATVAATNTLRAAHGLKPVRGSGTLSAAAAGHACDMATRGRMTHVGTSTKGPAQRVKALGYRPSITAENIAAGPFDLRQTLSAWQQSSGHLANILVPQLREVGIGRASNGSTNFWAAVYAAPR